MRRWLVVILVLSALNCREDQSVVSPQTSPTKGGRTATLAVGDSARAIPNRYIVFLADPVDDLQGVTQDISRTHGATIHYVYQHAFRGFAATFPPRAIEKLINDPRVRKIAQDHMEQFADVQSFPPNWGLDRIDQHSRPVDNIFRFFQSGGNVNVYVVDTGIRKTHPDFGGRALHGIGLGPGNADSDDCHGHGTGVAGVVGSSTYGVAKGSTLYAVKVAPDCTLNTSSAAIIWGLDWVVGNHIHSAVVNLSATLSIDGYEVIEALYNHGVPVIAAAGNAGVDACNASPITGLGFWVFTVAASDADDNRATFSDGRMSNFGSCVDIFAPGKDVMTTNLNGGASPQDGTSFAAPHVTGTVALMLQEDPFLTPAGVFDRVRRLGTTANVLSNIGLGSPNALLYSIHTGIYINGPISILSSGNYVWEAIPIGGDTNKSYVWEYRPVGGNNWQAVGTSRTYSRFVDVNFDQDFDLRVTHTSANDTRTDQVNVVVHGCQTITC